MMIRFQKFILCLFFATFNAATNKATMPLDSKPIKKIVFALDWTPNTNHLGLYTAVKQGYFKNAGLEVTFIQPTQTSTTQLVAAGRAAFGVT